MKLIADLHIHSRFARATSKDMTLENLGRWASKKGIKVMGTGDFTHPLWFKELQGQLEEAEPGLYKLRGEETNTRFLFTSEISCIYSKGGQVRRIHLILLSPSIAAVEKINTQLGWIGNLRSDGRPILGIDAKEVLKIALDASPDCMVVPAHCLPPGSLIHTQRELTKPIEDIKKGDLVYTHQSRWRKVTQIFTRPYKGKLYHVRPYYFGGGLSVTSEHPFYVLKTQKHCVYQHGFCHPGCSGKKHCCKKHTATKQNFTPQWVQAQDLEKGDVLLYPRFTQTKDVEYIALQDFLTIPYLQKEAPRENDSSQDENFSLRQSSGTLSSTTITMKGTRAKVFASVIPISRSFCRLIGYYLAEGSEGDDLISFTFAEHEEQYLSDVRGLMQEIFSLEPSKEQTKAGSVELIYYSKILKDFFSTLCYQPGSEEHRAFTKALPQWMLELPQEKQIEILLGWWRGDAGYTSSRVLMDQIKLIFLRLGVIPSVYVDTAQRRRERGNSFIEGRKINARHDSFAVNRLAFFEDRYGLLNMPEFRKYNYKTKIRHGWVDENYVYLPIRNIEIEDYEGDVYNLEVEEDNSYTTEFALVHNCWTPWFSVFGSKSGFNTLEECFDEYTKYIYAIETGLSCYDTETEVLTQDGWKKFSQVIPKDSLCTFNLETEEIEYQRPQRIYRARYRGKMYRLKTKRADLLVTPNHNLLYAPADFHTQRPYRLKEARDLFRKSKILRKDGIWKGETPQYFVLPEIKIRHGSKWYSGYRVKKAKKLPIKPWLQFFGFWIAEGWATIGKDGDYDVCVAANKAVARHKIVHILQELGYHPYSNEKIVRVRDYQLCSYLKQFSNGAAHKFIPRGIKALSKELLEILLEFYLKGDGHVYGRNGKGRSATTISTRLRDDLQEIALKTGVSAYYKLHNKKGTPFASPSQKKQYYQSADSWVIYFIRQNRHSIIPSAMKKYGYEERWVDYDGLVHCVSVPNHTVYIRRNGIPLWCGNSDPAMNWRLSALDKITLISNSDSHSLEKIGREVNVFDTEVSYSALMQAIKTKDPAKFLYTIEFFPEEGKYHYDGHRLCQVSMAPAESKKNNNMCPKCKRPLVIGVLNRVEELADRPEGFVPPGAVPFKSLIPLQEIIADALGVNVGTKQGKGEYERLIQEFGNEFAVLLDADIETLRQATLPEIAEGIKRVREGKVSIEPGYDGEYGKIKIFGEHEKRSSLSQKTLF